MENDRQSHRHLSVPSNETIGETRTSIRVLCTPEVAPGFSLAGIPILVAANDVDAVEHLRVLETTAERGGILLVEQTLMALIPARIVRRIKRQRLPVLLPFPSPALGGAERELDDDVIAILRRAIGYQVRLR